MSWYKILSHDREKEILQRSFLEGNISGAYLFWGPKGTGKDALAIEFAKLLNCISPIRNSNSVSACDKCSSCKEFDKLQNPNFKIVFAIPSGKSSDSKSDNSINLLTDAQIEEISGQIHLKAQNPYYRINISGASQIRIVSIRDLKKFLSMSSAHQGYKVVLISNADEMNTEAANALLKTLEEPNPKCVIILTSSRRELLPETILSRCRQVHIPPLSAESIEGYLTNNLNYSVSDAKLASAFAQGSINTAIDYFNDDIRMLKDEVIQMLRTSMKRKNFKVDLIKSIDNMVKSVDKAKLQNVIIILLLWLSDAYKIVLFRNTEHIVNTDQIEVLQRFAENFAESDFSSAINFIEESIYEIKRNVNPQLVLLTMFIQLRRIFLAKSS